MEGLIHIYCGEGKGKTTAAVGLGIRAAGYQIPVVFVQFMKDDKSSEISVLKTTKCIQVLHSPKNYGFYSYMKDYEKEQTKIMYEELLDKALELAKEVVKDIDLKADNDRITGLLILDEVISAYRYGLIPKDILIEFLKNKPSSLEVVLTGRDPSEELIELADYITEMKKIKHPYDKGVKARSGIEK